MKDKLILYKFLPEAHYKHLIQYQNGKYPDIHTFDSIMAAANLPYMFFEFQDRSGENQSMWFIYSQLRPYLAYLCKAQIPIKDYIVDFFKTCISELIKIYEKVYFEKSKVLSDELRSIYKNNDETAYTYNNTYLLAKNLCYLNLDYDFEYNKHTNEIFVYEITSSHKEARINHFKRIRYEESSINKHILSVAGATEIFRRSYGR